MSRSPAQQPRLVDEELITVAKIARKKGVSRHQVVMALTVAGIRARIVAGAYVISQADVPLIEAVLQPVPV